jgi:hypothetical protein
MSAYKCLHEKIKKKYEKFVLIALQYFIKYCKKTIILTCYNFYYNNQYIYMNLASKFRIY